MQYANIQMNAAESYGKNFRLREAERAQSPQVRETEAAQAAKAVKDDTGTNGTEASARTRSVEALVKMTDPVERFMQSVGVSIKFHVNEETEQIQAEVKSADGEKTIRKIPSDEILKLVASIKELAESEHTVDKAL